MTPSSLLCGWAPAAGVAIAVLIVPAVPVAQATAAVVMRGLDSPRGLAFGPEGALYVVEAGNGTINGPVHASETLELQPSARVRGDVHYKSLEIHHGAVVEGKLVHHEDSQAKSTGLKLAS